MAINWPNLSPKTKPFTNGEIAPKTNYSAIPNFTQQAGVRPGQSPVVGHTVAPQKINMRAVLDSLPSIFNITN